MSKQLRQIGQYILWYSYGDNLPYWISDSEGDELFNFKTLVDATEEMQRISERHEALAQHLEIDSSDLCVNDQYDEFYLIDGKQQWEVVTMDIAFQNECEFSDNLTVSEIIDFIKPDSIGAYKLMSSSKYFVREL